MFKNSTMFLQNQIYTVLYTRTSTHTHTQTYTHISKELGCVERCWYVLEGVGMCSNLLVCVNTLQHIPAPFNTSQLLAYVCVCLCVCVRACACVKYSIYLILQKHR